jgi:hypothetical protein
VFRFTLYSIHRCMPQDGYVTIVRYIGDNVNDEFYTGFGPTLPDQLCDARAKLKAALKGGK